jgi:Rap guanine nucleotide exchange factor 2
MITIAISTKSKPREIILARSKRNEQLPFEIKGGWDKGYGIYVSKVDTDSKANELGLRKGDQILEVNGQLFQYLPYTQAHDLLTTYTHLSIKVKYNPMAFNEMLLHPEKSPHRNKKNLMLRANNNFAGVNINLNSQFTDVTTVLEDNKMVTPRSKSKEPSSNGSISSSASSSHSSNHNLSSKFSSRGFNKIFDRFNKKSTNHKDADCSAPSLKSVTRSPSPSINLSTNNYNNKILTTSSSNNNITKLTNVNGSIENLIGSDNINAIDSTSTSCIYDESFTIEHVLKIYRNDQTFKYLVVHKVLFSLFKAIITNQN